jgi:hypothetical protein
MFRKTLAQKWRLLMYAIRKLPKENNRPIGEKLPVLVTLQLRIVGNLGNQIASK